MRKLSVLLISIIAIFVFSRCGANEPSLPSSEKSLYQGASKIKMGHSHESLIVKDKKVVGVLMKFRKISVHSVENGWFDAADFGESGKKVDLMSLRTPGDTQDVAYIQLGLGSYDQVKFTVFEDQAYAIVQKPDGYLKAKELEIVGEEITDPSALPVSGINAHDSEAPEFKEITFNHEYTVTEEGLTEITVDFNVKNSLKMREGDDFYFVPDVTLIDIKTTPGASRLIRAAYGGTVEILDKVSIDIPAGALAQDTVISILPTDSAVPSTTGVNRGFSLDNYVFLPENVPLQAEATVTMHYDPTILTMIDEVSGNNYLKEEMLDVQYFDPSLGHYVSAGRQLDKNKKTLTAKTMHFSDWSLSVDFVSLLFWLDRGLTAATWELRANDILKIGHDWNTTIVSSNGYNATTDYISYNKLVVNPNGQGEFKYNLDVQNRWSIYRDNYYPPNSEQAGYPMDPLLYVISLSDTVPGYATLTYNLQGITIDLLSKGFVDTAYGAYIFFHAAQRHDLCDNSGYSTYHKDFAICNQDFYQDMNRLCLNFYKYGKSSLWQRCFQAKESFKEFVDMALNLRISQGSSVRGSGCDDYDGVYKHTDITTGQVLKHRPVNFIFDPVNHPDEKYRHYYCPNHGSMNFAQMLSDLGIGIPPNIIVQLPKKECPPFAKPLIVTKWVYRPGTPDNIKVNIYRVNHVPQTGAWLENLWKVIDTFIFGQYFYTLADTAADYVANYNQTSWKDSVNGDIGNYKYFFKTYIDLGNDLKIYSEDPIDPSTGKEVYYEEDYGIAEFLNFCWAKTYNSFWPDATDPIRASAQEY